ncbi:MAG TPA: hypothetical protein VE338_10845 [Ktedonobacterales bacterium]|nr:hypothetical protein [Ktedonobacterales bacterium]
MFGSNEPNGLGGLIIRLYGEYQSALRAGAKAEVLSDILGKLVSALVAFGISPITAQWVAVALQFGKDQMQNQLDDAQLSPCEAAKPAHHARQAFDALDDGVRALRDWATDRRFISLPVPFRPPLKVRVPLHEIERQVIFLENLLDAASRAANRGTVEILRLRDARVRLGAIATSARQPFIRSTDYLIEIPEGPFHSEHERVKTMRRLLLRVAKQLEQAAKQGRKKLAQATLDKEGELVRPAPVLAVLAELNYTIACGLLTCVALRQLANEPIALERWDQPPTVTELADARAERRNLAT